MPRALALIDGEHYPPVVRSALAELRRDCDVVAAVFVGGTEKVDSAVGEETYGLPVIAAPDASAALREALGVFRPEVVIDLSDEPVLSPADRMSLASVALGFGVAYRGADFAFDPPLAEYTTSTPAIAIIGTGKRVGKTAVSADAARRLKAAGLDPVVVAMGRGGPAEPEVIRGDEVALTTDDLLALARRGVHAASDSYEDAVMSRVATVGCRRCGGGLAGATAISNVAEGARLADSLGKEIIILEGSGSAIPPVAADATLLVVGAAQGLPYVRDYFGPYRLARSDAVVIAGAEAPLVSPEEVGAIEAAVRDLRGDIPVMAVRFRPRPLAAVADARVFFATTAPPALLPTLSAHLERQHGCEVVGASPNLSNRAMLRDDLRAAEGHYDVLLTELKAAAVDVVAEAGVVAGVSTVLCDNEPLTADGTGLGALARDLYDLALTRHGMRTA
ncbi:MAG: 2,3-diphosphoglycerate synthetase [Actinobacteria bacterium]|nr:2,3-diphosphoglycerate synthetase [Actinomycetota bacterium]